MEVHFIRKLKKGGRGKYKCKLPFKCFKCACIGHFAIKYPYGEKEKEDEDSHREKCNWKKKSHFKSDNYKRQSFMYKHASSSDDSFKNESE